MAVRSISCLSPKKDRNQKEVGRTVIKKSSHTTTRRMEKEEDFDWDKLLLEHRRRRGSQVPSSSGRQFIQMAREDLSHRVFSPRQRPSILLLAYWLLIQSPTTSTSLSIHLA